MRKVYNENYTDDTRVSRSVPFRSWEDWIEWMNNREDGYFPKKTMMDVIDYMEFSLQCDLDNLEQLEYFKEDVPVKFSQVEGWVLTDWDKIEQLKESVGVKKHLLEYLNKLVEENKELNERINQIDKENERIYKIEVLEEKISSLINILGNGNLSDDERIRIEEELGEFEEEIHKL